MTHTPAENAARRVQDLQAQIDRLMAQKRWATTATRKQRIATAIRIAQAEIRSLV